MLTIIAVKLTFELRSKLTFVPAKNDIAASRK